MEGDLYHLCKPAKAWQSYFRCLRSREILPASCIDAIHDGRMRYVLM